MKRHNIYLYEYSNGSKGKNVGFCRMDVNDNSVKILLNIKSNELGIELEDVVDIKADLLMEGGQRKAFMCDDSIKSTGNYADTLEIEEVHRIVGVSLIYLKKNGIKINVQGLMDNCNFIEFKEEVVIEKNDKEHEQIKAQEIEMIREASENNMNARRIKQVELDDTVYNIDMECMKEKQLNTGAECEKSKLKISGIDYELIKLSLDDVTSLPRAYWKLVKNKFVVCGCNRYGHFAYMKQGDRYIICVPGNLEPQNAGCARRFGFNSYFPVNEASEEEKFNGYWMMRMSNNGK